MNSKYTKCFTIIALLFYVFSITFFCYSLITEYKSGSERTKRRFEHCTNVLSYELKNKTSGTSDFNNAINKTIGNLKDFAYIQITENNKTVYQYQKNTLENNSSTKLIKPYSTSFTVNNNAYIFEANLYTLKPSSIYYYARISFLIILIVTIDSIIVLIVISNESNSKEIILDNEIESNPGEKYFEENQQANIDEKQNNSMVSDTESVSIELNDIKQDDTSDTSDSSIEQNTQVTTSSENEPIKTEADEAEKTEPILEVSLPNNDSKPIVFENEPSVESPEGLFSPVTGLGWEQYLLTRLDSELNRAIASEFDLSLFEIKITNLSRESETVKRVCKQLALIFQFKDLLFEYKADSIVAIKINMNIDEAITFADSFYAEIKEILKDSFAKCYIGITSRTIRMISGERLLKEADEAVIHAQEFNESPIIGFRADAEKFRKYCENNK